MTDLFELRDDDAHLSRRELARLLPGFPAARVRDFFVTSEPEATFRGVPGTRASRPGPATALPALALAGAWTDTDWPATMEGAVRSGDAAARHVLDGQIRRGDGQRIYAAIWFSDLRDSTGWAESLPEKDYLALLNAYFECTAGAVIGSGGDVLLMIGDAVLAYIPKPKEPKPDAEKAKDADRKTAGADAEKAAEGADKD